MDKTLDLDELEKDAHGVLAYHNPSDPTPRVGVRATVLLTLIAAARPAGINTPDMPGQFEGDIWFGDPVKRNLGTHRWENGEWVLLPSELESVLELLAVRTAQRDAALSAARQAVVSDEVVEAMCRAHSASHRQSDDWDRFGPRTQAEHKVAMRAALALLPGGEGEGSSRSQPSRTAQEPPSPTPCDLEGVRIHEMTPEEFAAYSRTLGDA